MTDIPTFSRGRMSASPVRPQSPVPVEHTALFGTYERPGLCGRFTEFFIRNLGLLVILVVGLISLASFLDLEALLTPSTCKMHHDRFLGKLWLECPQVLQQVFGPRR